MYVKDEISWPWAQGPGQSLARAWAQGPGRTLAQTWAKGRFSADGFLNVILWLPQCR